MLQNTTPPEAILSRLFGPVLIGLIIAAMFSGIAIVQVITFARNSGGDPFGQKVTVWFIWVLDILHISVTTHMVYHYLVSHPKDTLIVWSVPLHLLIHMIIVPTSHWLYIARIWKIITSAQKYIPVLLGLWTSGNLVLGIYVIVEVSRYTSLLSALDVLGKPTVILYLTMSVCVNFLVAISLGCILAKAGTNLYWTNSSFTMLLAYFMNTGVLVSVFSLAVLIALLSSKRTLIFLGMEIICTRAYINSLLGMVNARYYLQPHRVAPPTALLLPSDTSSEHDPTDKASQRLSKTINEVGLPLFQPSVKSDNIQMLEVMVKREAHSSGD